jgi:hypothetical protein
MMTFHWPAYDTITDMRSLAASVQSVAGREIEYVAELLTRSEHLG